jgi:hypothetical protein
VHLVADHLGTIPGASYAPATASGAPDRKVDTRKSDEDTLLDRLTVAPQNTSVPYDRDDWPHWIDADGDCQNTRAEVLIRESVIDVSFTNPSACTVSSGSWLDPWTGLRFSQASDVDIDHTVALSNAHRSGGWSWTTNQKRAFANDLNNLEALRPMDDGTNSSKSDKGPEEWRPPDTRSWCRYATDWATIKVRWALTVVVAEYTAIESMLTTCDGDPKPPPESTTTTTIPTTTCDASYPTVCIPPPPPDLDCGDIPYRNFVVLQPDPHAFDGNNDGFGCQS